jgi:hypothetical protein
MMNRFILATLVSVFALVSGGCSDDNTTDPPQTTGSTTRWRVDWQKTTKWICPAGTTNHIYYTFETHGTDTFVVKVEDGSTFVDSVMGTVTSIRAFDLGNCAGTPYSGLTMDFAPSIANPTNYPIPRLEPQLAPKQLFCTSVGAMIAPGQATDFPIDPPQTPRAHPLSDANLTVLSSLEYRFPFPLTSGAVHDTTVIQPFTVWEFTQHAALTKLN